MLGCRVDVLGPDLMLVYGDNTLRHTVTPNLQIFYGVSRTSQAQHLLCTEMSHSKSDILVLDIEHSLQLQANAIPLSPSSLPTNDRFSNRPGDLKPLVSPETPSYPLLRASSASKSPEIL